MEELKKKILIQQDFEQRITSSFSQLQKLLQKVHYINREREKMKQEYITSVIGEYKLGDVVEVTLNDKYFFGTIKEMKVTSFGKIISFVLKNGKKEQKITYNVTKDNFILHRI